MLDGYDSVERWNQLDNVSARLIHGGAVWTLKGQVARDPSSKGPPSTRMDPLAQISAQTGDP